MTDAKEIAEENPAVSGFQFPNLTWGSFTSSVTSGLTTTIDLLKETAAKTVKVGSYKPRKALLKLIHLSTRGRRSKKRRRSG
jgi:hypothetical protein